MAVKIRTTEKHPHPVWERLIAEFPIAEIQGFILSCSDKELITATKSGNCSIPIQCLEAAEYETDDEFVPERFFSTADWRNKINASSFFGSSLLFLTRKLHDRVLFRLHQVNFTGNKVRFSEIRQFSDESSFIKWWGSIKKLAQTKKMTEAKPRQDLTIFDHIIERNGYSWGGNIDGFMLTDKTHSLKAIIEVRQSRSFPIEKYDPAHYFSGTATKGGDFKTWLPLIYLKKAYNIPVILLTFSTKSGSHFGFTEVLSINTSRLFYVDDRPPSENISNDFTILKDWIARITNK